MFNAWIPFTKEKFIKAYRPDGVGKISISAVDEDMNPVGEETTIFFDEVICDFCNKEITDDDIVWVKDSYAICNECKKKIKIKKG